MRAIGEGTAEVLETTAPWILVGLAVAAIAEPLLRSGWVNEFAGGFDVALFAILGMPVYVCAAGATPLVAVLIFTGVSPGAGLAFLLTGPATNVTTFGVLQRLHGRKIALAFGASMTLLAVVLGSAVNRFLTFGEFPAFAQEHDMGVGFQEMCLVAVTMLFRFTFLRRGPRAFVGELFDMGGEGGDEGEVTASTMTAVNPKMERTTTWEAAIPAVTTRLRRRRHDSRRRPRSSPFTRGVAERTISLRQLPFRSQRSSARWWGWNRPRILGPLPQIDFPDRRHVGVAGPSEKEKLLIQVLRKIPIFKGLSPTQGQADSGLVLSQVVQA